MDALRIAGKRRFTRRLLRWKFATKADLFVGCGSLAGELASAREAKQQEHPRLHLHPAFFFGGLRGLQARPLRWYVPLSTCTQSRASSGFRPVSIGRSVHLRCVSRR